MYPSSEGLNVFRPQQFLEWIERKFTSQMLLMKLVGIHPDSQESIMNPYTRKVSAQSFSNIGEHCIAVAYCATKIAQRLEHCGALSPQQVDTIIERALIHDLTKPYEIMRRDAQREGMKEDAYSTSAYEQLLPKLKEIGVTDEISQYLVNAGKETGHNSIAQFLEVGAGGELKLIRGAIVEKVVHLADDMTCSAIPARGSEPVTTFLSCAERMEASQFVSRYPFLWKEGLSVNSRGEIRHVQKIDIQTQGELVLGSYAALQVRLAGLIAKEIQSRIAPNYRGDPELYITNMVNDATSLSLR